VQEIGRIEHYNKIVAPKVTAIDAARAWIKSQREQQNAF